MYTLASPPAHGPDGHHSPLKHSVHCKTWESTREIGGQGEEEGSDHSIYYLASSPFSLFSTKLMLLLQTHKSLPVLANTPGVCLPLPSQAQEFAQGTTHPFLQGLF